MRSKQQERKLWGLFYYVKGRRIRYGSREFLSELSARIMADALNAQQQEAVKRGGSQYRPLVAERLS